MAVQEMVELLIGSIGEWNQWRQEHPQIRPDLSRANLFYANLEGANLSYADLSYANFSNAKFGDTIHYVNLQETAFGDPTYIVDVIRPTSRTNLSRTNLKGAYLADINLSGADLSSADLSRAYLAGTNLSGANLSGANLSGSELTGADLSGANLDGADLSGANFEVTTFVAVDLSSVKGIETASHKGPSIVDINSVTLPQGESTRFHFLRGVGFTKTQIEYLPSLLTPQPIQFHSLFISYAHQDETIAKHLYTDLCKKDVPCWFAPHDLRPGNYYRQGIDQAIHSQDKLLLLLSKDSVVSGWVRYEVELVLARENRQRREILFPIRLDDAVFHCSEDWAISLRETRHIGDFASWQNDATYQQAFTTLLQHLKVYKPSTDFAQKAEMYRRFFY